MNNIRGLEAHRGIFGHTTVVVRLRFSRQVAVADVFYRRADARYASALAIRALCHARRIAAHAGRDQ